MPIPRLLGRGAGPQGGGPVPGDGSCVRFLEGRVHRIICGKAHSFTVEVTFILKQT